MIYIIGGTPRSGKSTLAKSLAEKLKCSWVSCDTLERIPKYYTAKRDYAKKFPKDALRKATNNSNEALYSTYSSKRIMQAYLAQADSVWPAVNVFIDDIATTQVYENYVIEGYQIPPKKIALLQKKFPQHIKIIYLVKVDEQKIVKGVHAHKSQNDWVKSKSQSPEIYPKIAKMLSLFGQQITKQAKSSGLKVINTDTNFKKQLGSALSYLLN